jgi:uncharacterized membrane protein
MTRHQQLARNLFALGMMCLGILALVYSRLGMVWYSVPEWVPWGGGVTVASGLILLGGGVGLVFERTARRSAAILLTYLALWLLMRVPGLVADPLTAVLWENAAEIAALVAGAWILWARVAEWTEASKWRLATGPQGIRAARILFGLALIAFGVAHFAYVPQTAALVPAWLPFRTGWAYLTGAAHVAAGVGVLFSIYPWLAAMLEASMLSLFTVVVWVPAILAAPASMPTWTEIVVSLGVTAGAWVVAESLAAGD